MKWHDGCCLTLLPFCGSIQFFFFRNFTIKHSSWTQLLLNYWTYAFIIKSWNSFSHNTIFIIIWCYARSADFGRVEPIERIYSCINQIIWYNFSAPWNFLPNKSFFLFHTYFFSFCFSFIPFFWGIVLHCLSFVLLKVNYYFWFYEQKTICYKYVL